MKIAPFKTSVIVAVICSHALFGAGGEAFLRAKNVAKGLTLADKARLCANIETVAKGDTKEALAVKPATIPRLAKAGMKSDWEYDCTESAYLPAPSALASTWNISLAAQYGKAQAQEAKSRGKAASLAPCANLMRRFDEPHPERLLGEDAFLASRLIAAETRAMQSNGVAACVNYLNIPSREHDRALNEIYLAPFRAAIKDGDAYAVLAQDDRYLVKGVLRERWGFKGMAASNWGESAPKPIVERLALRSLYTMVRSGMLDGTNGVEAAAAPQLDETEMERVSLAVAEESIALLKNEGGRLPFEPLALDNILIIGDMADDGGKDELTPLAGVREYFASRHAKPEIEVAPLAKGDTCAKTHPIPLSRLATTNDTGAAAWETEWFDYAEVPQEVASVHGWSEAPGYAKASPPLARADAPLAFTIRWTAIVRPEEAGDYVLACDKDAESIVRILVDGAIALEGVRPGRIAKAVHMEKGVAYEISIVYIAKSETAQLSFGWRTPSEQPRTEDLKAKAEAADAVIVFAPSGEKRSDETDAAMSQILSWRTENAVVVCRSAAPEPFAWMDACPAFIHMPPCGRWGGKALARILFGDCPPSGRLAVTWPKSPADVPADKDGYFTGYRWHDFASVSPLFPFGHGLGYTEFDYEMESAEVARFAQTEDWFVSLPVKNIGKRPGRETVQIYATFPEGDETIRPVKKLVGFAKTRLLAPGEAETLTLRISPRDLAYWDSFSGSFRLDKGEYGIAVGASASDIKGKSKITVGEDYAFKD
ncbi:MAG: glycoside hydrolase family 3 C-terminal domain-containing protein [Kiritimatiellae bacterium]|nr:glycoside hydrolase family 3 C-terminal domain-containing protein [Kiritimatiellia bacterium]